MAEKKELYKGAKGLRFGAVILWILAIACEAGAIYLLSIYTDSLLYWMIGVLVLDAVLCIIGSLLWKKANRIKPSQSKNKVVKFFWDQLGVVMCLVAFIPIGILLLRSTDKIDAKTKKILLTVVGVLLAGSVAASIDYNPVSPGDSQNVEALIKSHYSADEYDVNESGDIVVYWTQFGGSMHIDDECYYIADSATKTSGTIAEAIESGKKDPCDNCLSEIKELNKDDIEALAEADADAEGAVEEAPPELTEEKAPSGDAVD
ncbi:MAG: hypothetical protein AB1Z23_01020 [Eubacteriales bacterium]